VVALGLLAERLEEPAQELVRGELLELGELLGRQLGKILRVAQPVEQTIRDLVAELPLDAFEDAREDPVVGIEVGLALHQPRAPEVVEAEQVGAVEALLERGEEGLPLLDGDRHALVAQAVEQVEEHAYWL